MEYEHEVVVTRAGADGKRAHVSSIYCTDRLNNNVEFVRWCGGDIAGDWGHCLCWLVWCGLALRGSYVLEGLCHVAREGFRGGRIVGLGVLVGEAWPRCVVAGPDGS